MHVKFIVRDEAHATERQTLLLPTPPHHPTRCFGSSHSECAYTIGWQEAKWSALGPRVWNMSLKEQNPARFPTDPLCLSNYQPVEGVVWGHVFLPLIYLSGCGSVRVRIPAEQKPCVQVANKTSDHFHISVLCSYHKRGVTVFSQSLVQPCLFLLLHQSSKASCSLNLTSNWSLYYTRMSCMQSTRGNHRTLLLKQSCLHFAQFVLVAPVDFRNYACIGGCKCDFWC